MTLFVATACHIWRWTFRLGVVLILLAGLSLPLARLLLPSLADYRAELEQQISASLQASAQIRKLKITWRVWEPTISLEGFRLKDPKSNNTLASFEKALLSVDLPASLLNGHWVLSNVRLEGLRLILEQTAAGSLRFFARRGGSPISLRDLANGLGRIRSLDLIADELQLKENNTNNRIFQHLRLSLRSEHGKRKLAAALTLPETLGKTLRGTLAVEGPADDPATWTLRFYVRGDHLQLAGWPLAKAFSGQTTLEVWGDWQGQALHSVLGRVHFRNLAPPEAPKFSPLKAWLTELPDITGQFSGRRSGGSWQWQSDWQGTDATHRSMMQTALDLTVKVPEDGSPSLLEGHARDLPLKAVTALAIPWLDKEQRTLLTELAPTGTIPELAFRLAGPFAPSTLSQPSHYALAARLQALATRPRSPIPGIQGLSGYLTLDQDGGRLDLDTSELRVETRQLAGNSITFDSLDGALQWRRRPTGWDVESSGLKLVNSDLSSHLQGSLRLFNDGRSPRLNLNLDYGPMDMDQIHTYLPVAFMPPKLSAWLDQALISGRITAGKTLFRGHIADFPFDQGQGLFETRLQVSDSLFNYFPHWPPIKNLKAEVVFRNRSLQVTATDGKIFDADLEHVQANIDDVKKALLKIHGQAQGRSATFLRFLRESPLAEKVAGYVRNMRAEGDNTLNLDLIIPLKHKPSQVKRPIQVEGVVGFSGGNLDLPNWDIALTHIKGELGFTKTSLSARDIQLLFQGEPAHLDISTPTGEQEKRETRFWLRGVFNPQVLLGTYSPKLGSYVTGKSPWNALLTIPAALPGAPMAFSLDLSSDLQGLAVQLPYPLNKTAEEARNFTAHAWLDDTHSLQLRLNYGEDVQAALELTEFLTQPRFNRGELCINAGAASLPQIPGLAVMANLSSFKLASLGSNTDSPRATLFPPWLSTIEAQFNELVIGKQHFPRMRLAAVQQDQALAVTLKGDRLAGHLHIPAIPSPDVPVEIKLDRLMLHQDHPLEKNNTEAPDPRHFPPLWVTVKNLALDDNSLGQLRLSIMPRARGFNLTNLVLRSELHQFTATGHWIINDNSHSSRLHARLHSQDLAKTLRTLGFRAALSGGETEAEFQGAWPAPLIQLSPEVINGRLSLAINQGQLLDVEPGIGRMLGLFNLNSLPRRANLDFSDLYEKGLSFDLMKGNFILENGQTYTDDLIIQAPAATISMKGWVGLKDRDYHQIITVIPQLGSPLTIAGAIAGGPVVGAAVFLAEQVLKPGIEQMTRYQYSLTGSWDNPIIAPLENSGAETSLESPFADTAPPLAKDH